MKDQVLVLPERPKEKYYIIAYIDLLGTKDLLKENSENALFDDIYDSYVLANRVMPVMESLKWDKPKIKIFSDNILIAHQIDNGDDRNNVYSAYKVVESFLKFFLSSLANKGILFRGAITADTLLINDVLVWGQGLSSVVYLEENIAIYPRIIISEDLLKIFDTFGVTGVRFEEKFSCLKDFDDCVFFDFFEYSDWGRMDNLLKSASDHIEKKIKSGASPRVMQKYKWFKNYIERVTEIYSEVQQDAEW